MTPYYADDFVTIYLGDSLETTVVHPELLIMDPPYGIEWEQHGGGRRGKSRGMLRHRGIVGDANTKARDHILGRFPGAVAAVFGSWRAEFPADVRQVLVYQKPSDSGVVGSVTGFRTDTEPVFLVGPWPVRDTQWSSVLRTQESLHSLREAGHPHAKPLDVLTRLLEAAPQKTVVDPFMGSGSTLVAAKRMGRRAIGIEIEERYCEIAANRLRQEVLGLTA